MNTGEHVAQALSLSVESRPAPLVRLDDKAEYCVLILNAFLKRFPRLHGERGPQARATELLLTGVRSEPELHTWIEEAFSRKVGGRLWDACRRDARSHEGIHLFRWTPPPAAPGRQTDGAASPPQIAVEWPCPTFLFCRGDPDFTFPWLAVFNSRKPRNISGDAEWLRALRQALHLYANPGIVLATSFGTLSYDMVRAYAHCAGIAQTVVSPLPLLHSSCHPDHFPDSGKPVPTLSCMLDRSTCHKSMALVCRDRILTVLAEAHLLIEIRRPGNLSAILEEQQARAPRRQVIFEPAKQSSSNAGNFHLLRGYPQHAQGFKLTRSHIDDPATTPSARPPGRRHSSIRGDPNWDNYLYHYTRACPGPWPGESYRDYLLKLLDNDVLSGHSALDTLARILLEGIIKAGSRLIKGREEVVCWSSHPPKDLFILRKWNNALVRWTVEPYGIAIKRDLLRSMGARPVIYGRSNDHSRLPASERYRYQLAQGIHTSWRHEREWRLRGDLSLSALKPKDYFIFVPGNNDMERLAGLTSMDLPLLSLGRSTDR